LPSFIRRVCSRRLNPWRSASGSGLSASYAYDAQGRRKSKTVNGATTIFVTDADNREVLEYRQLIILWLGHGKTCW
jgi:YD repeat-containing protein